MKANNLKYDRTRYFHVQEDGRGELRKEYILDYALFPGFYDLGEIPGIKFFVDEDYYYYAFLYGAKFPYPEIIECNFSGELEGRPSSLLREILNYDRLNLKEEYGEDGNEYLPDGSRVESICVRHSGELGSIVLTPCYFKEYLIETPQEKLVYELYQEIYNWMLNEFQRFIAAYEPEPE